MILSTKFKAAKQPCVIAGCCKSEHYICSNNECNNRICKKCFDGTNGKPTVLTPPSTLDDQVMDDNNDDKEDDDEDYNPFESSNSGSSYKTADCDEDSEEFSLFRVDDDNDESVESMTPRELTLAEQVMQAQLDHDFDAIGQDAEGFDNDYLPDQFDEFVIDSGYLPRDERDDDDGYDSDESMQGSDASERVDEGMVTTNAGQLPTTVLERVSNKARRVPGHVLLNQAGTLLQRNNHQITGKYNQTGFIQRMVSTIAGKSMPLVYLLATCFPRHWYASSTREQTGEERV